jgi:hypothetical protein
MLYCVADARDDIGREQALANMRLFMGDTGETSPEAEVVIGRLQTLGIEPRVVPERQPLPEVVPQPERRDGAVTYQKRLLSVCSLTHLVYKRRAHPGLDQW